MTDRRRWQLKADKAMQDWGRRTFTKCLVCGKPMACLHHYHTKASSSALRYDERNLIPICNGCHMQHHMGNATIHNTINKLKGNYWVNDLERRKHDHIKTNIEYYKSIIEKYAEENNKDSKGSIQRLSPTKK